MITYTTGSGGTCPQCGFFIPNGIVHVCPANHQAVLFRIACALERIATVLEQNDGKDNPARGAPE